VFELLATDSTTKARRGRLTTAHGVIETPVFMPVGTQGSVKTLHPKELVELDAEIILGNTYHLWLRPGEEIIRELGGLHQFSNWNRPILTDSGGFQVWSLAKLRKITEEGVRFQNHLDGSTMMLSPEKSMEIQAALGSDIAMLFDECPPYPCERSYAEESTHLTTRWGQRCKAWVEREKPRSGTGRQHHFGIVQGSTYADLREQSARELADLDLDGYAIGGVSVGEPEEEMFRAIDHAEPFLPAEKPRYAMGLGTPPQMLEMISRGVDLFDSVHPTRSARHGLAFTLDGPIHIKNARFERDSRPLCESCHPHVAKFSRAYIRHLFKASEILALRLLSFHNLDFYLRLARRAGEAVEAGDFTTFKEQFLARYEPNRAS
jgi:queuine tRNA-ribosyltransferase